MGKASIESRLNLPGKIGWVLMETPGLLNLLYIMFTLPRLNGHESLPAENWLMAGLFVGCHGSISCVFGAGLANPGSFGIDHPLHLPGPSLSAGAEPLYGPHPHRRGPCGSQLPVDQFNLRRGLARLLWSSDGSRLGGPQGMDPGRNDRLRLWFPWKHLPRRRATGDQTRGGEESTAKGGG